MTAQRDAIRSGLATLLRRWRGVPLAALAYLAITLFYLYPVSLYPRTLLPVHAYDTYQHVWALWWARFSLLQGIFPANVASLYAPGGLYFPLVWTWFPSLARGILLQPLFGPVGTLNILVIASFPLTGLAMYLLAYDVTRSKAGAFLAGLVLTFAPLRTLRLVGHFFLLDTFSLPIYVLFLLRLLRKPSWKNALGCGISLSLVGLGHMLYGAYFALPVTVVVLAYWVARQRRRYPYLQLLRYGLISMVIALAIIAPFYAPYLIDHFRDHLRFVDEGGHQAFSADLLSFVVPSAFNPLVQRFPSLTHYARSLVPAGGNAAESTVYLGWMAVLWGAVGIATQRRKSIVWCLVALAAAVLALGPILHIGGEPVMTGPPDAQQPLAMPYAWLADLPLFGIGRTPARFALTTLLAVAVLAAMGLGRFWASTLPRWIKIGAMGLTSALLLLELLIWWPLPAFPTPVSAFYTEMANTYVPSETTVLNVPMFHVRGQFIVPSANYGMIYQTVHEQRLVGGHFTRWPTRETGQAMGLDHLLDPDRGLDMFVYGSQSDPAAVLHYLDIGYVTVHKPITEASPPDVAAQAGALAGFLDERDGRDGADERLAQVLGTPLHDDSILWAWAVPEARVGRASATWLYAGRGWFDPQRIDGFTFRWMDGHKAEIFVEQPKAGWASLSLDVSARAHGELSLWIDGKPVHTVAIDPEMRTVRTPKVYLRDTSNRIVLRADLPWDRPESYAVRVANVSVEPLPAPSARGPASQK